MNIKNILMLGIIISILTACAPTVKMLDSNGKEVPKITYNYISSIKANQCFDVYMKSTRGWMIGYLEYNHDVDFLTAREMNKAESEKIIQQKTRSLLEYYKTKEEYSPNMNFMESFQTEISKASINPETGGLLFDNLYKTLSLSYIPGFNDVSLMPSYEARHGRLLDDESPRYIGQATGTLAPMYKNVQKVVLSIPHAILNDTILVESKDKIYLKLPEEQLREKVRLLISSQRPLRFTINIMFHFDSCSNNNLSMRIVKFQLIDNSTERMLIDWSESTL